MSKQTKFVGKPSKHRVTSEIYQEQADKYKGYLDVLGLSPETTQMRYLFLKEFFCFLEKEKVFEIENITQREISEYRRYLGGRISQRTGVPIKQDSIHSHLRNLQQYFGFLLKMQVLKINPASHLRFSNTTKQVERSFFTQEQIQELYKKANVEERMILHMGYGCGLRVQEISLLNKEDLLLRESTLIVQKGKNNKRRLVPLTEIIAEDVREFLQSEYTKDSKEKAVFVNIKSGRMQEWSFNLRLKQLILKTEFGRKNPKKIEELSMHSLRHSIATHLLENGMKLEMVQAFLGHSYIESTEIYTHVSPSQIENMKR